MSLRPATDAGARPAGTVFPMHLALRSELAHPDLPRRVADHIGATIDGDYGRCPACGSDDYGPNESVAGLDIYLDGYLPGAPTLVGVCLACDHIVEPAPNWGHDGDPLEVATGG